MLRFPGLVSTREEMQQCAAFFVENKADMIVLVYGAFTGDDISCGLADACRCPIVLWAPREEAWERQDRMYANALCSAAMNGASLASIHAPHHLLFGNKEEERVKTELRNLVLAYGVLKNLQGFTFGLFGYTCLLKSTTGKPEGPYKDVCEKPMTTRIDSSLFVDDDGTVYYVWQDGRIARMKDDMTGFAEEPRRVIQQHFDPEPYCEGVFLFKHGGKYHMALAIWTMDEGDHIAYSVGSIPQKVSYDCVVASADNVYGP